MRKKTAASLEDRLAEVRTQLTKEYGMGAIIDSSAAGLVEAIPTGMVMLDAALGCGGFPRGRIVELYGEEASGKSTIAFSTAAQCLKMGLPVLYLDFEHSFSSEYAATFGIDISNPLFNWSQPASAEQGAAIAEAMLEADVASLVVFDSLAAMATKKELDLKVDEVLVAPLARFMSAECRRLVPMADEAKAVLIFINHIHDKIGGYNPTGQARPTTPGGKALKFYASVRLQTKAYHAIQRDGKGLVTGSKEKTEIGMMFEATIRKNKVAPPGRRANYIIREGWGLCEQEIVLRVAEARNLVKKAGAYYTLPGGDDVIQGRDATVDYLRDTPAVYQPLRDQVRVELDRIYNAKPVGAGDGADDEEEDAA